MIECNSYLDLLTAIDPERPMVVRVVERMYEDHWWHACTPCYLDSIKSAPHATPWVAFKILLVPGRLIKSAPPHGAASCYMCHRWVMFD